MGLFQWLKHMHGGAREGAVHIPPPTPAVRRRYRFSGTVQGVGFRYEAKLLAEPLDLTGWARNEIDGTVTIEIEGEEGRIDQFLQAMQSVKRFSITGVQGEDMPLLGSETAFRPIY